MKKTPRKSKQWAKEAYAALLQALTILQEECPQPTEEQKVEWVRYAPIFAAMNRGIKAGEQLDAAHAYVFDCLSSDLEHHDPGEYVDYSILFLLAYLDAHISFGSISQSKADAIMEHLSERYEIADLVE